MNGIDVSIENYPPSGNPTPAYRSLISIDSNGADVEDDEPKIIYFTGYRTSQPQKLQKLNSVIAAKSGSGHLLTDRRFWDFTIEGLETHIRYGNFDADGVQKERAVQTQKHISNDDARRFISRLIEEKIEAGYVGWVRWT
ncbi:hypothetical protein G9A89_016923 [Geosiphon pyriformis]|nr:hypothetical protein G9A89_016923 [Geosiphon pyriformis]